MIKPLARTFTSLSLLSTAVALSACGVAIDKGHCLAIDGKTRDYGSIDEPVMDALAGIDEIIYTDNLRRLAIDESDDGTLSLRQKMVPSENGSERVLAGVKIKPARTYTLRQSVMFEPEFDWGGENEGGKLGFGLAGGSAPSGGDHQPDGFTVRFMWRGHGDGTAGLSVYSYAADRPTSRTKGMSYGEDLVIEGYELPIGEWIDMQMEVTTNSTLTDSDGSVRVLVNGNLLLEHDDIRWQAKGGEPTIDQLLYSTFYGGNDPTWSPETTTHIRFADVCWAAS